MQLGQSGGYPQVLEVVTADDAVVVRVPETQTIGPPGDSDMTMDVGSDTARLDSQDNFPDLLDPALTSAYSGDISPEQRRQDPIICAPLAPSRPIGWTGDASTLVAKTESSDTTLHDEEQGAEQCQQAWAMFDKHSKLHTENFKLSRKHSELSDQHYKLSRKYFTLACGLP